MKTLLSMIVLISFVWLTAYTVHAIGMTWYLIPLVISEVVIAV
jgi:hypothetical protein